MSGDSPKRAETIGAPAAAAPPITVLYSLAPPDGTTKYVNHLVDGAPDELNMHFFTWREALMGGYDAFHIHWPELTIRGKKPLKRFLRRRAVDLFVVLLKLRRVPLVRTVHNVAPHEAGSAAERRTLAKYDRATTLFIRLNATTELPSAAPVVTILHGHYRDAYSDFPQPPIEVGRILYFGIIRPYKGVAELLDVFTKLDRDDLTLRVVGSPSVGQRDMVEAAISADSRITAELRFVKDPELVAEIAAAELIVLPYREMHNSGSILAALSVGRPVLVPVSASNTLLKAEVGPGWIFDYDGDLRAEIIEDALAQVRLNAPGSVPRLDDRDLIKLGHEHVTAYRQAISLAKGTIQ
jgi:beta-1,4-mannosyltransferase